MLREGRESLSRERCCEKCCETHELSRKSDGSYRSHDGSYGSHEFRMAAQHIYRARLD